jgi:hypothetical protein
MALRLAAGGAGKPSCTDSAQGSLRLAPRRQHRAKPAAETAAMVYDRRKAMLQQTLWFSLFVALMFLLPPLVAMDLAVP